MSKDENGVSLDEFLEDFPTVKKEQAIELVESKEAFDPQNPSS